MFWKNIVYLIIHSSVSILNGKITFSCLQEADRNE